MLAQTSLDGSRQFGEPLFEFFFYFSILALLEPEKTLCCHLRQCLIPALDSVPKDNLHPALSESISCSVEIAEWFPPWNR
jgi:hypothetical protein